MPKGQQKSNREVRKPKKSSPPKANAPATVTSTFAVPTHKPGKNR